MLRRERIVGQPGRLVGPGRGPQRRGIHDQPGGGYRLLRQGGIGVTSARRIARNRIVRHAALLQHITHRLRRTARAAHERARRSLAPQQSVERGTHPLRIRIVAREPRPVATHAVHGADACGFGRHGVEVGEHGLFVGNRNVETAQFGQPLQQPWQLLDRRQLEEVVPAAGDAFTPEFFGEIACRGGVAQRPADQSETSHLRSRLARTASPIRSTAQIDRNPAAHSATAAARCASSPVIAR